jgi:hypothetical protein
VLSTKAARRTRNLNRPKGPLGKAHYTANLSEVPVYYNRRGMHCMEPCYFPECPYGTAQRYKRLVPMETPRKYTKKGIVFRYLGIRQNAVTLSVIYNLFITTFNSVRKREFSTVMLKELNCRLRSFLLKNEDLCARSQFLRNVVLANSINLRLAEANPNRIG